jgi:hypothetical protein
VQGGAGYVVSAGRFGKLAGAAVMKPPVKPGDVLRLHENDYLYGLGMLHLRVTKVGAVQRLVNQDWIDLEGLTLRSDGSPASNQVRHAVVRVGALRTALQRPEGTS